MLGYRVLVADDEPDIRDILRRLLLSDGFCVCEAGDGVEVLAAADHCEINVIVMDILMPDMSGFEAIQKLRADPRYAKTPIILITGSPLVRPMARSYQLGDMILFTKPLDLDQVLAMVNQMVQAA
jgi:CheY-like chemotaxis protein